MKTLNNRKLSTQEMIEIVKQYDGEETIKEFKKIEFFLKKLKGAVKRKFAISDCRISNHEDDNEVGVHFVKPKTIDGFEYRYVIDLRISKVSPFFYILHSCSRFMTSEMKSKEDREWSYLLFDDESFTSPFTRRQRDLELWLQKEFSKRGYYCISNEVPEEIIVHKPIKYKGSNWIPMQDLGRHIMYGYMEGDAFDELVEDRFPVSSWPDRTVIEPVYEDFSKLHKGFQIEKGKVIFTGEGTNNTAYLEVEKGLNELGATLLSEDKISSLWMIRKRLFYKLDVPYGTYFLIEVSRISSYCFIKHKLLSKNKDPERIKEYIMSDGLDGSYDGLVYVGDSDCLTEDVLPVLEANNYMILNEYFLSHKWCIQNKDTKEDIPITMGQTLLPKYVKFLEEDLYEIFEQQMKDNIVDEIPMKVKRNEDDTVVLTDGPFTRDLMEIENDDILSCEQMIEVAKKYDGKHTVPEYANIRPFIKKLKELYKDFYVECYDDYDLTIQIREKHRIIKGTDYLYITEIFISQKAPFYYVAHECYRSMTDKMKENEPRKWYYVGIDHEDFSKPFTIWQKDLEIFVRNEFLKMGYYFVPCEDVYTKNIRKPYVYEGLDWLPLQDSVISVMGAYFEKTDHFYEFFLEHVAPVSWPVNVVKENIYEDFSKLHKGFQIEKGKVIFTGEGTNNTVYLEVEKGLKELGATLLSEDKISSLWMIRKRLFYKLDVPYGTYFLIEVSRISSYCFIKNILISKNTDPSRVKEYFVTARLHYDQSVCMGDKYLLENKILPLLEDSNFVILYLGFLDHKWLILDKDKGEDVSIDIGKTLFPKYIQLMKDDLEGIFRQQIAENIVEEIPI